MSASTNSTHYKEGWTERFLKRIAQSPNVAAACRSAGVDRSLPYKLAAEDPEFASAWDAAKQEATDALEQAAWERAKRQSDMLMVQLLKAHRPEIYRDVPKSATITSNSKGGFDLTLSWGDIESAE